MANDPNIGLYGIGRGSAQIIDTTSGAQQQLSSILARQQQQRQMELKQMADQQAQLKPGALRNVDELNDFNNYQNDWRSKSIAATNEKDPYKKALAQAQADMAYTKAQNFVARSKQEQEQTQPLLADLSNPVKAYQYAPGSVQKVLANNNISVDNPKFVKNIGTTLQAAPDNDYADKTIKGINDKLINGATQNYQWDKPIKDPSGKMLQPWTLGQSIDPMADNGLAHQIANRASVINGVPVDPKFLNAFHARNADLFANVQNEDDLHMATNLAATREAQQGELYRKVGHGLDKPAETESQKIATHKAERLFDAAHPVNNGQVALGNTPTYEKGLSNRLQNPNTRDSAIGELNTMGLANETMRGGIITRKNNNGTIDITLPDTYKTDVKKQAVYDKAVENSKKDGNDKYKPNPNAGRVKISGGETITLNPNNPSEYDQNVAYIYNKLDPKGISGKALTPAGKGHIGTEQFKTVIKQSDIASKAANAGYSIKEYTNLLKQKGVKIQ